MGKNLAAKKISRAADTVRPCNTLVFVLVSMRTPVALLWRMLFLPQPADKLHNQPKREKTENDKLWPYFPNCCQYRVTQNGLLTQTDHDNPPHNAQYQHNACCGADKFFPGGLCAVHIRSPSADYLRKVHIAVGGKRSIIFPVAISKPSITIVSFFAARESMR